MKRLLLIMVVTVSALVLRAERQLVYVLPIQTEIDASAWQCTARACQIATDRGADLFVVHMNTFGGEVDYADRIRKALIALPMPTMAYIDHNAASAGAMIALACDTVFMAPGSSMGAVTMVDGSGTPLPDKYQSYGRSILRSTAELHGKNPDGSWRRDPEIAVRMVGPDSVITFTAEEAVAAHYAEGVEPSLSAAIAALGMGSAEVETFRPTVTDSLLGFLSSSAVRAILIMLIIGGIYMEMHTAGLGFAGAVSLVCAILYFLPMLVTGTLPGWILVLFIAGVILIALEIFVIPGFGVCGISGIAAVLVALSAALLDMNSISGINTRQTLQAAGVVGIGLLLAVALIWYLTGKHGPRWVRRTSELERELRNSDGYVGVDMSTAEVIGHTGVAMTDLRPAGKVRINGRDYEASSTGDWIEAGTSVRAVRYVGATLFVTLDL